MKRKIIVAGTHPERDSHLKTKNIRFCQHVVKIDCLTALRPTNRDTRITILRKLEPVASGGMQLVQIRGAVNQTGFTLIEVASTLIIIGLMISGILKAEELINNSKMKSLEKDFQTIPQLIYAYQDKFHALPGDDAHLINHLGTAAIACTPALAGKCATGNGVIDGAWNDTTIASESFVLWQHIRLAGLGGSSANANPSGSYFYTNSFGGIFGLQSNSGFTTITKNSAGMFSHMTGNFIICATGIAGEYAEQLDIAMDDGNPDTGYMRTVDPIGNSRSVSLTTVNNNQGQAYTVCMGV